MELLFAKEFRVPPGEVASRVSVEWWYRWLAWKKAQASHDLWSMWMSGESSAPMNSDQQELFNWAMLEDY